MTFTLVSDMHAAYHFLVRVWDGQSWSLGPIFEVKVDRNEKASKLALLLSERLGLDPDHLVCSKVSPGKSFRRGELLLRRWNKLRYQQVWLGQSTLELNRDGVYVVVRDVSVPMREELADEEVRRYCNAQVMEHLYKKRSREVGFQHKDALFAAAS